MHALAQLLSLGCQWAHSLSQTLFYGYRKALKYVSLSIAVTEAVLLPLMSAFVLFVLGKGGELSIPNSCFTLRNTDLRCDYASKMPTVTAVFSRKSQMKMALFSGLLAPGNVNLESNCVIR